MDFSNEISGYFGKLSNVLDKINRTQIDSFIQVLLKHYENNNNVYIFGNGGSGLTASHVVCDFNKGVCLDLDKKFKIICLNDNIASILAYANDISYDDIFYQQLRNFLTSKDLVIGISGSGNSKNVIKAIEYAKKIGANTFSLCGFNGGKLKEIDEVNCIHVNINDMQLVEDCHMVIFHAFMQILHKHLNKIK